MAVRVHLADDHTMFREGLETILASRGGMEVVGQSSSGGEDAIAIVGQKIGVRSRSEAVRMALMEQWIGLGEITSSVHRDGSSANPREN